EEVKEENKGEESTKKRKLGTRKKMKSRKKRYIQNTSEDDRNILSKNGRQSVLELNHRLIKLNDFEEINQNVMIRSNGQKRYFSTLMRVLSIFDREDLNVVYQLVMDRFQDDIPKGFDRVLWGDLMVMFNSDDEKEFIARLEYSELEVA
ncbi:hypothetical protein Tco_0288921, partial [Tanacetum coccineum]